MRLFGYVGVVILIIQITNKRLSYNGNMLSFQVRDRDSISFRRIMALSSAEERKSDKFEVNGSIPLGPIKTDYTIAGRTNGKSQAS